MPVEAEYELSKRQLAEAEQRKLDYQREKAGVNPENQVFIIAKPTETLLTILEQWKHQVERETQQQAETYVQGALKARDKDMEWFTRLNDEFERIEQLLEDYKGELSDTVQHVIIIQLGEIKTELEKQNAMLPKQDAALSELIRVLKEY